MIIYLCKIKKEQKNQIKTLITEDQAQTILQILLKNYENLRNQVTRWQSVQN